MFRLLFLLPLLFLAGCSLQTPFDPGPDVATENVTSSDVAAARATWEASGGESYTMRLKRACFCGTDWTGPFEVRVESGVIVEVELGGDRVPVERARSVDDLFDLLEAALARDAASVRAAFDPATGYPAGISIDYDFMIADEEVGYTVWDLDLR